MLVLVQLQSWTQKQKDHRETKFLGGLFIKQTNLLECFCVSRTHVLSAFLAREKLRSSRERLRITGIYLVIRDRKYFVILKIMKAKKDESFGIIPIRREGDSWQVFLIHQFSRIGNNSYWVFPKGHRDEGESPEEAAERELMEETGMKTVRLIKEPTFSLAYNFIFDGVKIEKTVTFFLSEVDDSNLILQEEEVKEAGWFSLENALNRLDYKDTKVMFREVINYLKNQ